VNPVDDDLASNVDDLAVCHVGLVLVQCLVDLLVHCDSLSEVERRLFWVLPFVVGAGRLDLANVGHDHILVLALALNEQGLDSLGIADVLDPAAATLGAVCGVENRNEVVLSLEPLQHVGDGSLGGRPAKSLAFLVVRVEEVCGRLWCVVAAVVAYVEAFCGDREPAQIPDNCEMNVSGTFFTEVCTRRSTLTFLCNQTLASGGQTDHDHAYPSVLHLDTDSIDLGAGSSPRGGEHELALRRPCGAGATCVRDGGVCDGFGRRHG